MHKRYIYPLAMNGVTRYDLFIPVLRLLKQFPSRQCCVLVRSPLSRSSEGHALALTVKAEIIEQGVTQERIVVRVESLSEWHTLEACLLFGGDDHSWWVHVGSNPC